MVSEKAYIKEDKATIVCPKCKKVTVQDVSPFKEIEESICIQHGCTCGHIYSVMLERRRFYRKEVNLPGMFMIGKDKPKQPMIVKDISRSGVKIEPSGQVELKIGDKLYIEFRLDNKHRTLIQRDVVIRNISCNIYGLEFASRNLSNPFDKAYDIAIGFYTFQ